MSKKATPLSYIELTSHSEETGFYDREPNFVEEVWPLLSRHSASVQQVHMFVNHYFSGSGLLMSKPSQDFVALGPMASLRPDRLSDVKNRSFFGGHLNVLYETSHNEGWLRSLFTLWLRPARLKSKSEDLGLRADEVERLQEFISSLSEEKVILAFGHDGDPLYVFGREQVLKSLSRLR